MIGTDKTLSITKNYTRILGLDPSMRATGIVAVHIEEKGTIRKMLMQELNSKETDPLDCGIEQVLEFKQILSDLQPTLAIVENFAYQGAGNRALDLVQVQTCFRLALKAEGVPWVTVAPTTLKKFILGKGTGKKPLVLKAVNERWGVDLKSHNVADAFGLAMLGASSQNHDTGPLTEKMQEASDLVRSYLFAAGYLTPDPPLAKSTATTRRSGK